MIILHQANHKKLCRRLRSVGKVQLNKESLTSDRLKDCELLVIGPPQAPYADGELRLLKDYVDGGGSLVVFSTDAGAQSTEATDSLNELLSDYGMEIEQTTLVRAAYHKYLHPKHALITNGIVQPEIGEEKHTPLNVDKTRNHRRRQVEDDLGGIEPSMSLEFVYPNGTSLAVKSPAYTLLSSGTVSYPVDCPIAAAWESTDIHIEQQGRVLVVGSYDMFADDWIEKEENSQLCDVLFRFLLRRNVTFDPSLGRSDFEEKQCVPDISQLSSMVKPCLHESEPLPQDYRSMICDDLFGVNNDRFPDVLEAYRQLNVPLQPLSLVMPEFAVESPPLRLATHMPELLDPPPPDLELFDLDECLEDVRVRLARLTDEYKAGGKLHHYIQEAGKLLDLKNAAQEGGDTVDEMLSKQILYEIGKKIFEHKLNHESSGYLRGDGGNI